MVQTDFIDACFGKSEGKKLDIVFNGSKDFTTYTDGILPYLLMDRAVTVICCHETGEVLYERNEQGIMCALGNNEDGSIAYFELPF